MGFPLHKPTSYWGTPMETSIFFRFSAGKPPGGNAREGLVEFAADFSPGLAGDHRRRNSPSNTGVDHKKNKYTYTIYIYIWYNVYIYMYWTIVNHANKQQIYDFQWIAEIFGRSSWEIVTGNRDCFFSCFKCNFYAPSTKSWECSEMRKMQLLGTFHLLKYWNYWEKRRLRFAIVYVWQRRLPTYSIDHQTGTDTLVLCQACCIKGWTVPAKSCRIMDNFPTNMPYMFGNSINHYHPLPGWQLCHVGYISGRSFHFFHPRMVEITNQEGRSVTISWYKLTTSWLHQVGQWSTKKKIHKLIPRLGARGELLGLPQDLIWWYFDGKNM